MRCQAALENGLSASLIEREENHTYAKQAILSELHASRFEQKFAGERQSSGLRRHYSYRRLRWPRDARGGRAR